MSTLLAVLATSIALAALQVLIWGLTRGGPILPKHKNRGDGVR